VFDVSLRPVVSAIAYGVAYEGVFNIGIGGVLKLIAYMILVDFVLLGLMIATATW
jgi:hypothetical protein